MTQLFRNLLQFVKPHGPKCVFESQRGIQGEFFGLLQCKCKRTILYELPRS